MFILLNEGTRLDPLRAIRYYVIVLSRKDPFSVSIEENRENHDGLGSGIGRIEFDENPTAALDRVIYDTRVDARNIVIAEISSIDESRGDNRNHECGIRGPYVP